MQFELLGPVRVLADGKPVDVGARKQRFVLALLALEANRLVPVDRMIDLVWPDGPPPTARETVQRHVSGLRSALAAAGAERAGVALRRQGPGYVLSCDPVLIDAHRFTDLLGRATDEVDPARRLELLDEALSLWRGSALAGTTGEAVRETLCLHLEESRLTAVEQRLDTLLALGRDAEAVNQLTRLTAEHPERHRLAELLITSLHRTGRVGEALTVYRQVKRRLAEELGLDPPARLQQLELAILRNETLRPEPARSGPAQLPADIPSFTGRDDPLARLDNLLGSAVGAVVVSAIDGTAGVGKTALAVHWGHRVRRHFSDGQLYVNLHGFEQGGKILDPGAALRGFLGALNVEPQRIPAGLDEQAALYRSLLAGKRMLIVLDNARDTAQVRPLLPGEPGCLVVVTSRNQLTSLVGGHGATPIGLDLLTTAEAEQLLARRLGAERVAAEPEAVAEIIAACARLPLALVLVAAHAATRPEARLATLARDLSDGRQRWRTLTGDEPGSDIPTVLSWSYHALSPAAARMLRLVGLHPGPDFTEPAAESLTGLPPDRLRPLLDELVHASLLTVPRPGRYTFHDLLRAYARERAAAEDSDDVRRAAIHRMLDHYLYAAYEGEWLLNPSRFRPALAEPRPGVHLREFGDHQEAYDWFAAERAVLLAVVDHAAAAGFDTHAWQLAWAMQTFLDRHGDWPDQVFVGRLAVTAAQRSHDVAAQTRAQHALGYAYQQVGRLGDARVHLERAAELAEQLGDRALRAHVHTSLSVADDREGRIEAALGHAQQALRLLQDCGDRNGEARALNAVGWYQVLLGDYRGAVEHCERALTLFRRLGVREGEAGTLDSLGYAYHHLGDYPRALDSYRAAGAIVRELGDRYLEAVSLIHLADSHQAAGDRQSATDALTRALAVLDDLNHPEAAEVRAKLAGFDAPDNHPAR